MLKKIYDALVKNGYFILTINIFDEHKDRDEAHPHCFTKNDIWDLIKKKFHILHMEENDWYGLKNYVNGKKDIYGKELVLIMQKMGENMKPIYFKEHNKVYAKNQPEYLQLPVYEDDEQGGRVFHCWELSLVERIKILFTGKLWINVLNFGKKLQPIKPMVECPFEQK